MSSPGRSYRQGVSLLELMEMFPDEESAVEWFESIFWVNGRCCGHCGGTRTSETPSGKPQPYWCPDCRSYFSIRSADDLGEHRVRPLLLAQVAGADAVRDRLSFVIVQRSGAQRPGVDFHRASSRASASMPVWHCRSFSVRSSTSVYVQFLQLRQTSTLARRGRFSTNRNDDRTLVGRMHRNAFVPRQTSALAQDPRGADRDVVRAEDVG